MKNLIIPTPQRASFTEGTFNISEVKKIGIEKSEHKFIALEISKSLKNRFEIDSKVVSGSGDIKLKLVKNISEIIDLKAPLYNQSYQLIITDKNITITAISNRGLFYGAMSLIQMIENVPTNEIRTGIITDYPDMELRGISDDISRGQVSNITNFKRIIDFIARYKMNVYMPYLEDMLEFEKYPSIGIGRGRLSKSEVKEIVEYATERYIDVIPAFQTLGHFENILTQKEFVDYAEFPGAASLAVTEAKTYTFIEDMLNVVFELFPSKYINIGADESYDVGYGKSKELTKRVGKSKVHAEHYKKVFDICRKNGKKIMMYGDVILNHTKILELIPNDVTIIDWHYGANTSYPSTDIFKDAGFKYIISPSVWNFRTTFPTYQIALPNIKTIIGDGLLNGSSGMINSNWGDYGAETFKEFVLFGYAWSAQCAWNYKASSLSEFNNSFFADFFGVDDYKLNSLYKTFSTQFNQMQWHEVWRHPVLDLPKSAWWAARINREEVTSWMNWTLPDAFKTIEEFENLVTKNRDHLDLLRFTINLNYWYQNKLKASYYLTSTIELNSLRDELSKSKKNKEKVKSKIISIERRLEAVNLNKLIDDNISQLKELQNQYQNLWLKYYKKDNLNMIMDKFDRLIAYFEEAKEAVDNGELSRPTIKSEWIYASKRKQTAYKKAEFKREFTVKNNVTSAKLQLLADTHAKLYINNKFIGEIYSKRSLSLLTEYDRILYLDVTKHIKKGKNKIVIKVENYKSNKGAGLNFISEIRTTNGMFEVISDKKWQSRLLDSKNKWKKSITKNYKYTVIAPNFSTNRTSWIER
ncbi:MAG: family 20 glycosylhydrolase [Melioribacteraceae bacterium]|nr:family 20 glycosylhydrolase [Melioribacteraceae bacterium]